MFPCVGDLAADCNASSWWTRRRNALANWGPFHGDGARHERGQQPQESCSDPRTAVRPSLQDQYGECEKQWSSGCCRACTLSQWIQKADPTSLARRWGFDYTCMVWLYFSLGYDSIQSIGAIPCGLETQNNLRNFTTNAIMCTANHAIKHQAWLLWELSPLYCSQVQWCVSVTCLSRTRYVGRCFGCRTVITEPTFKARSLWMSSSLFMVRVWWFGFELTMLMFVIDIAAVMIVFKSSMNPALFHREQCCVLATSFCLLAVESKILIKR